MKTIKYFLLAFALLSIFAKCTKDPIPDPNSFYFQCKLNGKLYLPNNCANCMTADFYGDTAFVLGGNNGFESVGIGLHDLAGVSVKKYLLNGSIAGSASYDNSPLVSDIFLTDITHSGSLSITTLDKVNKIISGTFYFKAYNAYTNDSVSVTNGQFRLKYKS